MEALDSWLRVGLLRLDFWEWSSSFTPSYASFS